MSNWEVVIGLEVHIQLAPLFMAASLDCSLKIRSI